MDTMTQGTENISVNLSLNAQRDTVLYRNVFLISLLTVVV